MVKSNLKSNLSLPGRMKIAFKDIKIDCRQFKGDIPCKPHKQDGAHCIDEYGVVCKHYDPTNKKVLIIKLGAIGDVIRTTPILRKLKTVEPDSEIWWLTLSPEVIPKIVDVILPFSVQSLAVVQAFKFDLVFNLDKDKDACAICSTIPAQTKKGFTMSNGKCIPCDALAHHKYITGLFDDISKSNNKSYQQEIFEMCGYEFTSEEYIMPEFENYSWKLPRKKKIVGLNTGCGGRWTSRLWPEKNWIMLARRLIKAGFVPLFLGGEQEHKKNLMLAKQSGGLYLGHFPLQQFMSEVNHCDLVVTAVTMAMHIAIGLRKKVVLFNNIFNKNEFELYGRGEIIEPEFECDCYYSPECANNCMQYITVERTFNTVLSLLK